MRVARAHSILPIAMNGVGVRETARRLVAEDRCADARWLERAWGRGRGAPVGCAEERRAGQQFGAADLRHHRHSPASRRSARDRPITQSSPSEEGADEAMRRGIVDSMHRWRPSTHPGSSRVGKPHRIRDWGRVLVTSKPMSGSMTADICATSPVRGNAADGVRTVVGRAHDRHTGHSSALSRRHMLRSKQGLVERSGRYIVAMVPRRRPLIAAVRCPTGRVSSIIGATRTDG